jgi:hypothetical protein
MTIIQIYRNLIPYKIRAFIKDFRFNIGKFLLYKKIKNYSNKNILTKDLQEVFDFTIKNGLSVFPYYFKYNYKLGDIKVHYDQNYRMCYVLHNNEKLYFKKSWDHEKVKVYYNSLLIEQDKNSPHLYLTSDFNVDNNSIVFDLGVAEGIFSLGVINNVSQLFLFEPDPEWIEALSITFSPWKNKVSIINKYVSDINEINNLSIDKFWESEETIDLVKIDVDGFEQKVLDGMKEILRLKKINKIALCTYHENYDDINFKSFLEKFNYNIEFSNGFMLFYNHGTKLAPPYFRKGLLRATK